MRGFGSSRGGGRARAASARAAACLVAAVAAACALAGCGPDEPGEPAPGPSSPRTPPRPASGGPGVSNRGPAGSGGPGAPPSALGPVELEERLANRLAQLPVHDEAEIRLFLERMGAGTPPRTEAELRNTMTALTRLARDHRAPVRRGAIAALARIPGGHLPTDPFTYAFLDPVAEVRLQAVIGRTRHGAETYWKFFVPLASDPDVRVRVAVAQALATLPGTEPRQALRAMLADESDAVVDAVARALGPTITEQIPAEVIAATRSNRAGVRIAAAKILGETRLPAAMPLLVALVKDPLWDVRREAIRSLRRVQGEAAYDARIVIETVALDASRTRTERFEALQALAMTESEPSLDRLDLVATRDPDPMLRLAGARALLARSDPRGLGVLVDLLDVETSSHVDQDDREFIRHEAAATLRAATGDEPPDDLASTWRRRLPDLLARMPAGGFAYAPGFMSRTW